MAMQWKMTGWLTASLLLLGGCTQERPSTTKVVQTGPALWEVRDADTTIYLFGTVHVMQPDTQWMNNQIKTAFDKSQELVLEIVEPDDPNSIASAMATRAAAKDGIALSSRLSAASRANYQAAMANYRLPWQAFENFNPWMAGLMLSVAPLERLGYKAELGAEKILTAQAKATGKKISGLETVDQQMGYFATLPMPEQIAFLNATVDGLPNIEKEFSSLITHWRTGQPDKLAKEMNDTMSATPELTKILLTNRNINWAYWIKTRLDQPGTVFVAVGAGHLAGEESVQQQLQALGITSRRVKD